MIEQTIFDQIDEMTKRLINGGDISTDEGLWLLNLDHDYLPWLMSSADRLRKTFRGNQVEVCAISNVRSGNCSENCSFCAQSGHHKKTEAPVYNYISDEELAKQAEQAREWGASDFGVVSKGWGVRSDKEHTKLKDYFSTMQSRSDIGRCASLGVLDEDTATTLKSYGLENYHHNLESAESYFDKVCTTHTYQENIDTIKHARDAGLRVCAGGILGMGESKQQRIELADTLRQLNVESVPLNFLNAQPGTPFADIKSMEPYDILQSIAVFRFMLPRAEIRIAGGRTFLGDLQSMIFMAGASGVMIGDYLTTKGREVKDDLRMIKDLKLEIRGNTQQRRDQSQEKHLNTSTSTG